MADTNEDWSSNSNEAVEISLVVPGAGAPKALHTFNPKFTYPIFGDEETIFGYKGLKVNLRYNASDMRPSLQITWNSKFKTVGETEPLDVKAVLEPYLPKTALEKTSIFNAAITDPMYKDWKPPGELWKTIQSGDQTFEVWKGSLADLAIQQMVKRIQILVPLFIEGGTFIELQDPEWSLERWTVFFLYEKKKGFSEAVSPYLFMGYSTVYRYFYYQSTASSRQRPKNQLISNEAKFDFKLPLNNISFNSLPCRSRISQFIILPPFQHGGNGSRFYNAIFDFYLGEHQTMEITVEDPNEAFDDLRDINDLSRLRTMPEFLALKVNDSVKIQRKGPVPRDILDLEKLEAIRRKIKIAPRQFYRVVEMQLLSLIPQGVRQSLLPEHEKGKGPEPQTHVYRLWKLWVKKRLYKHNKDMMLQIDKSERTEKLDQAVSGVEDDYARLLRQSELRKGPGRRVSATSETNGGSSNGNGKRSSSDDEVEDEEPAAKKAKIST
ncbi:histone acetyltransferase-like protein type b catalytic subunit [Mollisia scopiformis]|uniref:Histone acetyltransferase type B catalytic subunit n=1 Tax=Mollisia scopiformis TaxID=149040 RepID=A0A132B5F5_MOLSC|nr:histone acetyltransferase-like protein type b catalytic subunit [Mollisia scopiformis]KUJ07219.1 histone acetyltransferas-like protein type b catalytic subunit [Mollisia scopiformis]